MINDEFCKWSHHYIVVPCVFFFFENKKFVKESFPYLAVPSPSQVRIIQTLYSLNQIINSTILQDITDYLTL